MTRARRSLRLSLVWLGFLLLGLWLAGCDDRIPVVVDQPSIAPQAPATQSKPAEQESATRTIEGDLLQADQPQSDAEPRPDINPSPIAKQNEPSESSDEAPGEPEPSAGLVWSDQPLPIHGSRGQFRSWRDVQAQDAQINDVLRAEQAWCDADERVAELRASYRASQPTALLSEVETPASEQELVWLTAVAQITADVRGEHFIDLPIVRVIDRWDLRRLGCVSGFITNWLTNPHQLQRSGALEQFRRLLTPLSSEFHVADELGIWTPLIGGAFHPVSLDGRRVTLIGSRPLPQRAASIAAHEFAHALQDQRTVSELMRTFDGSSTDSRTALMWLLEGEATVVADEVAADPAMRTLLANRQWGEDVVLDRRDPLFSNALRYTRLVALSAEQSAYSGGAQLIGEIRDAGGWEAIDALFLDPPWTMEQIMHRGKLAAREAPIELRDLERLTEAIGDGWAPPVVNRMGESSLRGFLRETLGRRSEIAELAAAGWGSDQLSVWSSQDDQTRQLAVWQLVFDQRRHHVQAWNAMVLWLAVHSEGGARAAIGRPVVGWAGPAGIVRLFQQGESIWLLAANDLELADDLTLAMLDFPLERYWSDN